MSPQLLTWTIHWWFDDPSFFGHSASHSLGDFPQEWFCVFLRTALDGSRTKFLLQNSMSPHDWMQAYCQRCRRSLFGDFFLSGGNSNIFLCSPLFGEDEPILTSIFFRWVETTNQFLFILLETNISHLWTKNINLPKQLGRGHVHLSRRAILLLLTVNVCHLSSDSNPLLDLLVEFSHVKYEGKGLYYVASHTLAMIP